MEDDEIQFIYGHKRLISLIEKAKVFKTLLSEDI